VRQCRLDLGEARFDDLVAGVLEDETARSRNLSTSSVRVPSEAR